MVQDPSTLDAYPLDKEILLCPKDNINLGFYVCKGEKLNSSGLSSVQSLSHVWLFATPHEPQHMVQSFPASILRHSNGLKEIKIKMSRRPVCL